MLQNCIKRRINGHYFDQTYFVHIFIRYRNDCQEKNGHADVENMELFSLCSHSNETLSTEQKLILGTCSTILLHYLKENSYFGKKLPTTLPRWLFGIRRKRQLVFSFSFSAFQSTVYTFYYKWSIVDTMTLMLTVILANMMSL